jgi:hypothetical protein
MLKESRKKRCSKCARNIGIENFSKDKSKKDGLKSYCKKCASGFYHRWHSDNDFQDIKYFKYYTILEKSKCVDCEENNIACLQFDHVRDNKIMSVSQMVSKNYNWSSIRKEINKCDIVCANCHAKRTARRQKWYKKICNIKLKLQNNNLRYRTKLTKKEILEIRDKYSSENYSYTDLSKEYGVSASWIGRIVKKQAWDYPEFYGN